MRFFASASALLAMATAALAQTADFDPIFRPATGDDVVAGATFTITWEAPVKYADGTISIHLIGGATQGTLQAVADIASGVPNSEESFAWTVGADLGADAVYGLVFKLESNPDVFQYSQPFSIKPSSNEGGEDGGDEGSDEGSDGGVVIITTAIGTKTVTLTSCPPTETTAVPTISVPLNTTSIETTSIETTFLPPPPTSTLITTTKYENTTTPVVIPPPTFVQPPVPTTEVPPPPPPATTPEVPASGAARFGSALFAVVGGVAAVLLL